MPSTFIKWLRRLPTTRLGRWQTQKTVESVKRTIDFANMDHCGTCAWTEKRYYCIADDVIELDPQVRLNHEEI